MNTGVEVAIISAAASIIVAAVSWVVTARQKRADELRKLKMERYSELLASISKLCSNFRTKFMLVIKTPRLSVMMSF